MCHLELWTKNGAITVLTLLERELCGSIYRFAEFGIPVAKF